MKEDFLHYIWQYQLFEKSRLFTACGEPLEILRPGQHNHDSGPDFFNAKLVLGNTIWAGNIEIHIQGADWQRHGHQHDAAYNNVILHVVYEDDQKARNQEGKAIPVLELKSRIAPGLLERYAGFLSGKKWVPCAHLLPSVDALAARPFLHRLAIERLEQKSREIMKEFERNGRNWEQTFYEFMARNFGFKVNALPFHLLAKSIPHPILARHRENKLQVEALLLGQAGMLEPDFSDPYPQLLKKEYRHLRLKYGLTPVSASMWKLSKMRPANFPSVRIVQFAELVHRSVSLFSKAMSIRNMEEGSALFEIEASGYWADHYTPDGKPVKRKKAFGRNSVDNIFVNTIAPFLFVYGSYREDPSYQERALAFLENAGAEENGITKGWKQLGINASNAFDSQALIQLKNNYCNAKKCLNCSIGNLILKNGNIS